MRYWGLADGQLALLLGALGSVYAKMDSCKGGFGEEEARLG